MQQICLFSTPNCVSGSLPNVTEISPICPYPLVVPDAPSFEADTVYVIPGTACALPCPSMVFSPESWANFKRINLIMFTFALVLSSATLISLSRNFEKNFNIIMYTGGCTFASFWSFVYTYISYFQGTEMICKGNAGAIESEPFCVFTGWALLSTVNWVR